MSTLPKCLTIIRNLHRNRIEFEANQLSVRLLGWAVQDAVSSSCQLSLPAVQTNEDDESHRWAISQICLGLTVYSTVHLLAFPRKMRCRKKNRGLMGVVAPPLRKNGFMSFTDKQLICKIIKITKWSSQGQFSTTCLSLLCSTCVFVWEWNLLEIHRIHVRNQRKLAIQ